MDVSKGHLFVALPCGFQKVGDYFVGQHSQGAWSIQNASSTISMYNKKENNNNNSNKK